jgi:hypothetical protein
MNRFFRRNFAEISVILGALAMIAVLCTANQARAADSYTPDLRIVQMPTGSNDTQWGIKANAAFAMLEQGIAGGASISVTGANVTLTTANNASDQARNAILAFTGTPGTQRTVVMPNVSKLTWVSNASDSNIVFTAGAGVNTIVAPGGLALIYTDGATNANGVVKTTTFGAGLLAAADAAAGRTALGLGTAATHAATDFMLGSNNLSELTNVATARTTLGLGNAALATVSATSLPLAAVTGTPVSANLAQFSGTAGTITDSGTALSALLTKAGNLSGLGSASTARTNLGLANGATATITASTSDPSGTPNNNDIWIKY